VVPAQVAIEDAAAQVAATILLLKDALPLSGCRTAALGSE